jgi:hypothetical protein
MVLPHAWGWTARLSFLEWGNLASMRSSMLDLQPASLS